LRGRFLFLEEHTLGIVCIFPLEEEKMFLFSSSNLHFETWVVVLVTILVVQSCSFASRKAVNKMRKMDFKPHFLLS